MPSTRFAIIDPVAGASGDMLLGALISAGAPRAWLEDLPRRLGCEGVTVAIDEVDRCGIRATQVTVRLPGGAAEGPGEPHAHADAHTHEHPGVPGHVHGSHRYVGDLIRIIERAPLSPWVVERATRAFRLLGEAEGRVHGAAPDGVALHEVGAVDALVDIVGVIEGFERLGLTRIYNRPVALGEGWVRAAHGEIPVPAPATSILLEGMEIGPNGPVTGEATTPTGAALLRALSSGAPPESWRAVSAGAWGAGARNPAAYPNAVRLIIAEASDEIGDIVVLATDVDDLNPEYLEPLRSALFAAGAVDVQVWTTQGKKGRASFRVEIQAPVSAVDAVGDALFRNSGTTGLRIWRAERVTLARRIFLVPAEDGSVVRVKLVEGPGGLRAKPEYDDIIGLAALSGRPAHLVAKELQDKAVRLAGDMSAGSDNPTHEA